MPLESPSISGPNSSQSFSNFDSDRIADVFTSERKRLIQVVQFRRVAAAAAKQCEMEALVFVQRLSLGIDHGRRGSLDPAALARARNQHVVRFRPNHAFLRQATARRSGRAPLRGLAPHPEPAPRR